MSAAYDSVSFQPRRGDHRAAGVDRLRASPPKHPRAASRVSPWLASFVRRANRARQSGGLRRACRLRVEDLPAPRRHRPRRRGQVQEVFVVAHRRWEEFANRGHGPRAWLFQIVLARRLGCAPASTTASRRPRRGIAQERQSIEPPQAVAVARKQALDSARSSARVDRHGTARGARPPRDRADDRAGDRADAGAPAEHGLFEVTRRAGRARCGAAPGSRAPIPLATRRRPMSAPRPTPAPSSPPLAPTARSRPIATRSPEDRGLDRYRCGTAAGATVLSLVPAASATGVAAGAAAAAATATTSAGTAATSAAAAAPAAFAID